MSRAEQRYEPRRAIGLTTWDLSPADDSVDTEPTCHGSETGLLLDYATLIYGYKR